MNTTTTSVLDELWYRKPIRVHVKEFACILSFVMLCVIAFLLYKDIAFNIASSLFAICCILLALGYLAPKILYPVWKAWMAFAQALGSIVTFIILFVTWVFMLIPMSYVLRILKIKVVDLSFAAPVDSYWEKREERLNNPKLLERQF